MKTTPMNCQYCQNPFEAKRTDAKFCSGACKQNAYLDRMKDYTKQKETNNLLQKNQFAETVNQLEQKVIEVKKIKEAQLQREQEAQLQSINEVLEKIKQDETQRNIKNTNGMLKGWIEQLLSLEQQEEVYLFKVKSLCADIIRFTDSSHFTNLPKGYKYLEFINHTLSPKVKSWYDGIKNSNERYIHLALSDELKVKFTRMLGQIDGQLDC